MQGQRGWRELQALGDKINQFTGIIEGLIWSPKGSDSNDRRDDWAFEEVLVEPAWIRNCVFLLPCIGEDDICIFSKLIWYSPKISVKKQLFFFWLTSYMLKCV